MTTPHCEGRHEIRWLRQAQAVCQPRPLWCEVFWHGKPVVGTGI